MSKDWEKEFDKWFEDTWVAGSTGYIDIHRDEINDMKKDINNFIRQREKELLQEVVELVANYNPPDSVLKEIKELFNGKSS